MAYETTVIHILKVYHLLSTYHLHALTIANMSGLGSHTSFESSCNLWVAFSWSIIQEQCIGVCGIGCYCKLKCYLLHNSDGLRHGSYIITGYGLPLLELRSMCSCTMWLQINIPDWNHTHMRLEGDQRRIFFVPGDNFRLCILKIQSHKGKWHLSCWTSSQDPNEEKQLLTENHQNPQSHHDIPKNDNTLPASCEPYSPYWYRC